MIDHYVRLGLKPGASAEEIKTSFRKLVKKHHPDVSGGNAAFFARIKEAYDVLSDPANRALFERLYGLYGTPRRPPRARGTAPRGRDTLRRNRGAAGPRPERTPQRTRARPVPASRTTPWPGQRRAAAETATAPRPAALTRLMSMAVPRPAKMIFENLTGRIIVAPTTPENLWETTLKKFGAADLGHLAGHVIQVKATGAKDRVRGILPRAAGAGAELRAEGGAPGRDGGAAGPSLLIKCTVPHGTMLVFSNTFGAIIVGDLEGELQANLDGRTSLRAGRLSRARLVLKGSSTAWLAAVEGEADLLTQEGGRIVLDGNLKVLRAAAEDQSAVEVLGPVDRLEARVEDSGFVHLKDAVRVAHYDVRGTGYLRIAEAKILVTGHRGGAAKVDVLRRPFIVPVSRAGAKRHATPG